MPEEYNEQKRIAEERNKQKKLEKQRIETAEQIVRTLLNQKKIEKEHLNLVEEHLKYWNAKIENTEDDNKERYNSLKKRLKKEEEIRNKIIDHMNQLDKEIEFHRKHIH